MSVGRGTLLYLHYTNHSVMESTQRPAPGAPIAVALSNSSMRVHFAAVPGDTYAAMYIHERLNGTLYSTRFSVDGISGMVVPFGQRANPFKCINGNCIDIVGLSTYATYTATLRSREPDAIDWGPESPHSEILSLCNASQIPGAPVATKQGEDAILVRWNVPFGTSNVAVFIWHNRNLNVIDYTTRTQMKFGSHGVTGWPITTTQCLVTNLPEGKYDFTIACYNDVLWGTCSPHSTSTWIARSTELVLNSPQFSYEFTSNVDERHADSQYDDSTKAQLRRRKYQITP